MFNKSKKMDYVKVQEWVLDVIRSCKTKEQIESAGRLVKLYKQQTNKDAYLNIHRFLNHVLIEKSNRIEYGYNGR